MGQQEDLTAAFRRVLNKPKGYKVFYASGLNVKDVRLLASSLSAEEKDQAVGLYNASFGANITDLSQAPDEMLLAMFIALFDTASNVSHIANAYAGTEDVFAILHESSLEDDEIQIIATASDTAKLSRNVNYEVTQLFRGTYWAKNRREGIYGQSNRNIYSPVEYLTVVAVTNGSVRVLVRNKPILANHSFIVAKDGAVKRQMYGDTNKFIDEDGRDHRADL